MTSRKRRRRELARQRYERQTQRRAEAERRRRRRTRILVGVVVGALVVASAVGLVVALTDETDSQAAAPEQTAEPTQDEVSAAGQCEYIDDAPDPSVVTDVGRPDPDPGDLGPLTAVLTLNGEDVTLALDGSAAPCTANSWQFLSSEDYYDDTPCHRLTTSSTLGVLQCGDPSGTGRGGPGYRYAEENLEGATYEAGTVAMAKTSEPSTTGSQFFLVHSDSQLPPSYTVVGTVTDGLDIIQDIAEAGTVDGTTDGAPAAEATVEDLVVERSGS